jgi:four helix bundle protein
MKESIVGGKAFYYALRIIYLFRELDKKREFVISNQLLRCSTSIGANIEEAMPQAAVRILRAKWQSPPKKPGNQDIGSG